MKKAYINVILSVVAVSCLFFSLHVGISRAESEEPAANSEETPTAGQMKSSPAQPRLPSQSRPELDTKMRKLPGRGPDLVITRVEGVPEGVHHTGGHGLFVAIITVENVGNKDALFPPDTWIIGGPSRSTKDHGFSRTTTNEKTQSELAIKPGETLIKSLWGEILSHENQMKYEFKVVFQVDPQNRVQELNERNNAWTKTLKLPDLVVDTVSFSPPDPDMYSQVTIQVDVRNQGAAEASFREFEGDHIWDSRIEGVSIRARVSARNVDILWPGKTFSGDRELVQPGELEKGCYRVVVTVDPDNAIPETDETNNTKIGYLSIGGASCQALKLEDKRGQYKQSDSKRLGPALRMR